MADLARLLVEVDMALSKSERRPSEWARKTFKPVFDAAADRFALRQARICDELSDAVHESYPGKAARLHQLAAKYRDLVHRK